MGFLVRDIPVVPRKLTYKHSTQPKRSCKNCETHRQHSQNSIKRRLYTKDNHNELDKEINKSEDYQQFSSASNEVNKFLVTRPNKVYNLQELVPPSFWLPDNFYSNSENPSTFQSFLVRQNYRKTPMYKEELEPIQKHAFSPSFSNEYLSFEPKSTNRLRVNYVTSTQKTLETDDWAVHWIQM